MTVVELTREELFFAGQAGLLRHLDAELRGRQPKFSVGRDLWQGHVCGAMAEYAFAKYAKQFWLPWHARPWDVPADVGDKTQIRCQPDSDHAPRLVVRDSDRDDHAFVLVTYTLPRFTLHGWCWGGHAKREDLRQDASGDKPPCWFVPVAVLQPIPERA